MATNFFSQNSRISSFSQRCPLLSYFFSTYNITGRMKVQNFYQGLIGHDSLVRSKLLSLDDRRKVAGLWVLYQIYFIECLQELQKSVSPPPLLIDLLEIRRKDPYVVDLPPFYTKCFAKKCTAEHEIHGQYTCFSKIEVWGHSRME